MFLPSVTKRFLPILVVLALALVAPGAASAKITELGARAPAAKPSCGAGTTDCVALSRTTGYQGRSGTLRNPFAVPSRGRIVAFTVALGDPSPDQLSFFTSNYGATASIRLSIFRQGQKRKTRRTFRLIRQSPVYSLNSYFGSSPQFALDKALPVTKGYVVAVTSPTWAPIFATALDGKNWWRASRTRTTDDKCRSISRNAAVQKVNSVTAFGCDYFKVRLMYTATFIADPKPTKK